MAPLVWVNPRVIEYMHEFKNYWYSCDTQNDGGHDNVDRLFDLIVDRTQCSYERDQCYADKHRGPTPVDGLKRSRIHE